MHAEATQRHDTLAKPREEELDSPPKVSEVSGGTEEASKRTTAYKVVERPTQSTLVGGMAHVPSLRLTPRPAWHR